jgi:site-specific DNA recombinase
MYAAGRGWTVVEVYDLAGQSGKAVMEHPEAKRMMKDIERGHITGLVFSKLARLSRNLREVQDFGDFFSKNKADLISLNEAIDTSTAGGRMFFHLLGVFAQWEREEITERVNASVAIRARLRKTINGHAPYGYQWKNRKFIIQPEEAPIRRKAYELFLQHRRKGKVAKLLTASGYRTREGANWSDTQVARILVDTSAKGIYHFNRMRKGSNDIVKPESEWGKVECEPIVSETLWHQVNQILEEQPKDYKKPGPSPVQVFGNLARCQCGSKRYVRSNSPKYVCTKCHNKITIDDLDAIVYEELKDFFTQPDRISSLIEDASKNLVEKQTLLATHEKEIQKVREDMTRTHRLFLDGGITSQGFAQFYKPSEERLNQLLAELPKLQAEFDYLKVNDLSAEQVLSEGRSLYERWPTLERDEKRQIVEFLIEKLVIGDNEIDITLSCLPSSEELTKSQRTFTGMLVAPSSTDRKIHRRKGSPISRTPHWHTAYP